MGTAAGVDGAFAVRWTLVQHAACRRMGHETPMHALFDAGHQLVFDRSVGQLLRHVQIGPDHFSAATAFQPDGDGSTRRQRADEAKERDKNVHASHCPSGSDKAAQPQQIVFAAVPLRNPYATLSGLTLSGCCEVTLLRGSKTHDYQCTWAELR